MLKLISEDIDGWKLHALEFDEDKNILKKVVPGQLSNSQTKRGKEIRFDCQINIAKEIKLIEEQSLEMIKVNTPFLLG